MCFNNIDLLSMFDGSELRLRETKAVAHSVTAGLFDELKCSTLSILQPSSFRMGAVLANHKHSEAKLSWLRMISNYKLHNFKKV